MECQQKNHVYQCDLCPKAFPIPAKLARHYRSHTGQKPFSCKFCTKTFSVKENLSVHMRLHTQEKPFTCTVCSRSFEHSGKLNRHMRIHTGERPHKCKLCEKTFIQSGQLVIHMRTHTGEKPYVCSTCGKGFTCSKQLKVHQRTHTGEKPYNCEICGKSFGYNHVLKLHQLAHYGEKMYKCTICAVTFSNKKQLENHIKSHDDNVHQDSNKIKCYNEIDMDQYSHIKDINKDFDQDYGKMIKFGSHFLPVNPFIEPSQSVIVPPRSVISNFARTSINDEFILPSIDTICPKNIGEDKKHLTVLTNLVRDRPRLSAFSPITQIPNMPVTSELVAGLIREDIEQFGDTDTLLSPPLSLPPTPSPSPPTAMSLMTESSLPLRKRRYAGLSDSISEPSLTPPSTPTMGRISVIQFAAR